MKQLINLRFNLVLAALLLSLGFVGLWYEQSHQPTVIVPPQSSVLAAATGKELPATTDTTAQQSTPATGSGQPTRFFIPSLQIDLTVTPGYYNPRTGQWTLTLDKVQYAVMTPEPNTVGGNTFLYGHDRRGVFATLHNIKKGAEAILKTENGTTYTYVLSHVEVVSPYNSAGIFDYEGAPILTVQTCTGTFYQDRQLFTFTLERTT